MRIAHVVTLVSPDGAFGGPVRVAVNLARAQRDLGHEAVILGAYRGDEALPAEIEGVPAQLFPARSLLPGLGFSGIVAPGLARHLREAARSFDAIHVHMTRDLVTLPAADFARRRGIPYVIQAHGQIDRSSKLLARLLDGLRTRRVFRSARRLFYLTQREERELRAVAGTDELPLEFLPNGVPSTALRADVESGNEVLFLARLHPRKRPLDFVEAALRLHAEFPDTRFAMVGPDEGEAEAVRTAIAASGADGWLVWEGPLAPSETLTRMSRASVYALPSIDEPFPMTVLEAMSIGLPCVVTEECGLASAVRDPTSLTVVPATVPTLVAAVRGLLADASERVAAGERGRREAVETFSMSRIASIALGAYPCA